jgi:hypothetical protein
MYSVAKFFSRSGRLGRPLDDPFVSFGAERVKFRHGATSMLAGKPGAGKSIFALNMLDRWAREAIPIMYFSADSDEYTVARRLGGIISGLPTDRIEQMRPRELGAVLDVDYLKHVRFEYRTNGRDETAADFIAGRMVAYEQMYGAFPSVVFVDNLINYAPSAQDWGAMIDLLNEFNSLALETMSHICVLHHASRGYGNSADPVPVEAIQGKVDQIPRLVLTIAASGNMRAVACVKNTNGPQHPSADKWMQFEVEPSLFMRDCYEELVR